MPRIVVTYNENFTAGSEEYGALAELCGVLRQISLQAISDAMVGFGLSFSDVPEIDHVGLWTYAHGTLSENVEDVGIVVYPPAVAESPDRYREHIKRALDIILAPHIAQLGVFNRGVELDVILEKTSGTVYGKDGMPYSTW